MILKLTYSTGAEDKTKEFTDVYELERFIRHYLEVMQYEGAGFELEVEKEQKTERKKS